MKKVTIQEAINALDHLDDYAKMAISVDPIGPREVIENFIKQTANNKQKADKLKLKGEFETMLILTFPDIEWNFRWDSKNQDYFSREMAWHFFCYIKGRYHNDV